MERILLCPDIYDEALALLSNGMVLRVIGYDEDSYSYHVIVDSLGLVGYVEKDGVAFYQ